MPVLINWTCFLIALTFIGLLSGLTIGFVARTQKWSVKGIHAANLLFIFLLTALADYARKGMHLPYPPHDLAQSGYSFLAAWGGAMLI
jgi:predicted transporter